MAKVASNSASAQAASQGVTNTSSAQGKTANVAESNITAMTTGADVANRMVDNVNSFIESVKIQANKFPQLANAMEVRDSSDAASMNSGGGK